MGFALMMALVGWYFYDSLALGGVIAVAMVVNLLIAALAGVLVPLIFVRFGMDPAVSSGTFVTTLTDLFGFFTFLGLASLVLM
jgi:magnesium transporter